MGMLAIANADLLLIRHLKAGGSIWDETAALHVHAIVENALSEREVRDAAQVARLSHGELANLYRGWTDALGQNPLIHHGRPMIATTLIFMDPKKLPQFLAIISRGGVLDPEVEADALAIARNGFELVHQLQQEAVRRRGQAELSRAGGCGGVIIAGLTGVLCLL